MQHENGSPLPKFGEWDVNDPASAEGFTVIFNKARDEIATACIQLTQSEGFNTRENLQLVINHCKNYKIHTIQRIAIKSLDRVFVDILPSYTVDKHNPNDNVSKETKKRREYESTLLELSRQFIQICEKVAFSSSSEQSCRSAAALALSDIYASKPGFNTSKALSATIIKLACANNEHVRQIACEKISEIFRTDPNGEATLTLVSKMAVTPTTQISAELLQTLMDVKMNSKRQQSTKKHKKRTKFLTKTSSKNFEKPTFSTTGQTKKKSARSTFWSSSSVFFSNF